MPAKLGTLALSLSAMHNRTRPTLFLNCLQSDPVSCARSIKNVVPNSKHPFKTITSSPYKQSFPKLPAMDVFISIFTSSLPEETPSQIDFETTGGAGNGYCVIA
jgi:hypothetical protein